MPAPFLLGLRGETSGPCVRTTANNAAEFAPQKKTIRVLDPGFSSSVPLDLPFASSYNSRTIQQPQGRDFAFCAKRRRGKPCSAEQGETLRQKDSALLHFWKMPLKRLPMGQIPRAG